MRDVGDFNLYAHCINIYIYIRKYAFYACRPPAKIYRPRRSGNASRRIKAIRDRRFFRTTGYPGLTTFNSTRPPPSMRTLGFDGFLRPHKQKKKTPADRRATPTILPVRFVSFSRPFFRPKLSHNLVFFNFVIFFCTRYITIEHSCGYKISQQPATSVQIKRWMVVKIFLSTTR